METACVANYSINESTVKPSEFRYASVLEGWEEQHYTCVYWWLRY